MLCTNVRFWKLEHPKGQASPTAEEEQKYQNLCEAVLHAKDLVRVAANKLWPHRYLTKKVSLRYGDAKRYTIKLADELQYAPAWTVRRQHETQAAYQLSGFLQITEAFRTFL